MNRKKLEAVSQEILAETAKLKRAYVGIERGKTDVSLRTALKLAKALDITLARVRERV